MLSGGGKTGSLPVPLGLVRYCSIWGVDWRPGDETTLATISKIVKQHKVTIKKWWRGQDLNPRTAGHESSVEVDGDRAVVG